MVYNQLVLEGIRDIVGGEIEYDKVHPVLVVRHDLAILVVDGDNMITLDGEDARIYSDYCAEEDKDGFTILTGWNGVVIGIVGESLPAVAEMYGKLKG